MACIDGLDIPFQHYTDATFFEFGPGHPRSAGALTLRTAVGPPGTATVDPPSAHPGHTPAGLYRWEYTDRALAEQLALETEGYSATVEPGHTAVRCTNPTTGADVLPTLRTEFHRLAPDTLTAARSEVGSSFFEVSTVRAPSPSATRAGTSNAATCSSCPPGSR